MKRLVMKTVSLILLLAFFANTCCYGLATLPASQNPLIKREIEAALQRTQIRYAESEDAIRLLNANNAECLLLSSGKYLVTKEVAENDLKLLRSIIHEDIEAIMQILAKENGYKYQGIKELILKYFPPSESNNLPVNLYVNHTVARAFEWLSLLEDRIIVKGEISPEEGAFISAITPIIMANKHNYFTTEFWDPKVRSKKIKVALNKGMIFYQVASTSPENIRGQDIVRAIIDRPDLLKAHPPLATEENLKAIMPELGISVEESIGQFDFDSCPGLRTLAAFIEANKALATEKNLRIALAVFKGKSDYHEPADELALKIFIKANPSLNKGLAYYKTTNTLHEKIVQFLQIVMRSSSKEKEQKNALYRLILIYNADEANFLKIWKEIKTHSETNSIIVEAEKRGILDRITNNVAKRIAMFDETTERKMASSIEEMDAWMSNARQHTVSKNLRVLAILGVPANKGAGSGVVATNLLKEHARNGNDVCLSVADYEPVSSAGLGLPDNAKVRTLLFMNPEDSHQRPPPDVFLPIPTYSRGMPFPHTRYKDMTQLELIEFLETYYDHLEKVITEFKPDVIHTNHLFLINPLVKIIAPWIPVVCTTHGTEEKMLMEDKSLAPLVIPAAQAIERVLSISPAVTDEAEGIFGIDKSRVTPIGNGYDDSLFQPKDISKKAVLEKLGIKGDFEKVVLFVGKYAEWKGIEYLIDAASQYSKKYQEGQVITLIIGDGPEELRRKYQDKINKLEMGDYIKLVGGLYGDRQKEIADVMNIADAFVLPSVSEPFGLVLLEALACGCRVISTNRGGPPSFVPNNLQKEGLAMLMPPIQLTETGVIREDAIQPFVNHLQSAVTTLLEKEKSPNERQEISKAVQRMGWGKIYEDVKRVYQEVLNERLEHVSQFINATLTIPLNSKKARIKELVGEKAVGINTLIETNIPGFNVPDGFVVTINASNQFISSINGLKGNLLELDNLSQRLIRNETKYTAEERTRLEGQINALANEIQELILKNTIPENMISEIKNAYTVLGKGKGEEFKVAIRSSALSEDTGEASYAGQYETKLGVASTKEAIRSIKEVWASLFSQRAIEYRNNLFKKYSALGKDTKEFTHSCARMAVVVQEFIDAQSSGVAYSVNIKTGQPEIVIESILGIGERHVQGEVTPDSWRFYCGNGQPVLLEQVIQPKTYVSALINEQTKPAMSEAEASILAQTVWRLGEYLKRIKNIDFIDVEFALNKEGKLYLLQVRPVTAIPSLDINPVCEGVDIDAAKQNGLKLIELNGKVGFPGVSSGRLVIINEPNNYPEHDNLIAARKIVRDGDILCTPTVNIGWTTLFDKIGGLIVERGGMTSHSATIAREKGIPAIVGAENACVLLQQYNGTEVTLDAYNMALTAGMASLTRRPLNDLLWREVSYGKEYDRRQPSHFIDSKGKEWAKTPVYPLSPLQLQLYYDAMLEAKKMFPDIDMPVFIKDDTIYVGYDELIAIGDKMCSAGIDNNEEFFNDRVQAVEKFLRLAQGFEVNNKNARDFFDIYTHMIAHFHLRAGFRRRAALLLRERVMQNLPKEVRNLVMHLISMNSPMEWSETRERDLEYRQLLYDLKKEEKEPFLSGKDADQILLQLREKFPDLFKKLTIFLMRYRVERYQRDDWNAPLPYKLIVAQIKDDLTKGLDREPIGPQIIRPLAGFEAFLRTLEEPIKKYNPSFDFNSFLRILMLSEQQGAQVDNERHWQHRYQYIIRNKFLDFGEKLVGKGLLTSPEQLLMKNKEEVLNLIKIYELGGKSAGRAIDKGATEKSLLRPQVDYVELHPTNMCNLCNAPCCKGFCTYENRHKGKETFPFERLEDVAKLQPSYIFIVGGGEPTLYNYKGKALSDLILKLRELLPNTTLVLVTNGIRFLGGDWQREISSIRISFHGYRRSDFEKGEPRHIIKTWENIWKYFEGPIGEIWVTYRFDKDNYLEIPALAEMVWERWEKMCKNNPQLRKKEFGFKMTYTADDNRPDNPYHLSNPDESMQKKWTEACRAIKESGRPFGNFLKQIEEEHLATNFSLPKELVSGRLVKKEAPPAEKCLLAADYVLVGADSRAYPCAIKAANEEFSFGNISQPPAELMSARSELFNNPLQTCKKAGCRLKNSVMGALVDKKMQAINNKRILDDYENGKNPDIKPQGDASLELESSDLLKEIVSRDRQRVENSGYRNIGAFPDGRGSYFFDNFGMEGLWNCDIECSRPLSNRHILRTVDAVSRAIGGIVKPGFMIEIKFVDNIPSGLQDFIIQGDQAAVSFSAKRIYISAFLTEKSRAEQENIIKDLIKDRVADLFVPEPSESVIPVQQINANDHPTVSVTQIAMVEPQRAKDYLHYKFNYRLKMMAHSLQKKGFDASYLPIEDELSCRRFLENYREKKHDLVIFSLYQIKDAELAIIDKLVKEVRGINPNALIAVEGPSTNAAKQVLALIPDVDILIRGESEIPISILLSAMERNKILTRNQLLTLAHKIGTGVFMRQRANIVISNLHRTSINTDVDMLEPTRDILCMWYTEHGCPLNCAFCRKDTGGTQGKRLVGAEARIEWMLKRLIMEISPECKVGIEDLCKILRHQANNPHTNIGNHPGIVLLKDTFIGKEQIEILVLSENALATRDNMMRFAHLIKEYDLQRYFKFKIADTTIMSLIKNGEPDIEYIRALKEMNVYFIGFGTENVSETILRQLGKAQDGEVPGHYGTDKIIALNKALLEAGFSPTCIRNNLIFTTPTSSLHDVKQSILLIYMAPFINSVPDYFGNGWGNNRYARVGGGGAVTHMGSVDNILYASKYIFPWEKINASRGKASYYAFDNFYISPDTPEYMIRKEGTDLTYKNEKVLEFAKEFGGDTFYRYAQEDFIRRHFNESDIVETLAEWHESTSQEVRDLAFIIDIYRKLFPQSDLFSLLFTIKAHMVSLRVLSFFDYQTMLQKNGEIPVLLERFGVGAMIANGNIHMLPGSFEPESAIRYFRKAAIIAPIVILFAMENHADMEEAVLKEVIRICILDSSTMEDKVKQIRATVKLFPEADILIKKILERDEMTQKALQNEGFIPRISYPDTQAFEYLRYLYTTKTDRDILNMIVAKMNEKKLPFNKAVRELVCEKLRIKNDEYTLYVNAIKEYENVQKYFCKGALLSRLRSHDPEVAAMAVQKLLDAVEIEENPYLVRCFVANLLDIAKAGDVLETGVFVIEQKVMLKIADQAGIVPCNSILVLGRSLVLADRDINNQEKAHILQNTFAKEYGVRFTSALIAALETGDWKSLRVVGKTIYLTGTVSYEREFLTEYADKMKFNNNAELFGAWLGRFSELSGKHRLRLMSEIKKGLDTSKGLPNSRHVIHPAEEFLYVLPILKKLRDEPGTFVIFIARDSEPFYNAWQFLTEYFLGTNMTDSAAYAITIRSVKDGGSCTEPLYNSIVSLLSKDERVEILQESTWARILSELDKRKMKAGLDGYLKEKWGISGGIQQLMSSRISRGDLVKYICGYGLDEEFVKFFLWVKKMREARTFFIGNESRHTLNEYIAFLRDICIKYDRPLSEKEIVELKQTMEKFTDTNGYLLISQQELMFVAFLIYISDATAGNIRERMQHAVRPILNITLEGTDFSRKLESKENILIADVSSSTSSTMLLSELALRAFKANVNVTTFNFTQSTEEIARLARINMIDNIGTIGIWAGEDINEFYQGAFLPTERGVREFKSYRYLHKELLDRSAKTINATAEEGERLIEQFNAKLDEVVHQYNELFLPVDSVVTARYNLQEIKREIIKSIIRSNDPVEKIILQNYLFCVNPFEAYFVGRDTFFTVCIAAQKKFGDINTLSEIRELDSKIRYLDQAREMEKYARSAESRIKDTFAAFTVFTQEPLKAYIEQYLSDSLSFEVLKEAFYRLHHPRDRLPYQAKEICMDEGGNIAYIATASYQSRYSVEANSASGLHAALNNTNPKIKNATTQAIKDLIDKREELATFISANHGSNSTIHEIVFSAKKYLRSIKQILEGLEENINTITKQEIESAIILLSDLLYSQLHEGRTYEIKYDTSRLTPSQIDILETYAELLKVRCSNPENIRLRPFSSINGSKESLIAVYCTGKDFKGEGHIDVSITEGELKDYLLRITGMVNIALASSNIPDNLSREDVDKYRPILSYINNQYKAILGEALAIPDSPEDILKVIRRIVLGLPKAMRTNTNQIEEYNRLAKEALIAA